MRIVRHYFDARGNGAVSGHIDHGVRFMRRNERENARIAEHHRTIFRISANIDFRKLDEAVIVVHEVECVIHISAAHRIPPNVFHAKRLEAGRRIRQLRCRSRWAGVRCSLQIPLNGIASPRA